MDQSGTRTGRLVLKAHPHLGIPALYVHDLTGTLDAIRLLRVTPPTHPMTAEVLPRLCRLNPEIAAKFVEKAAFEQTPFKLITMNQSWNSADIRSFVAISYCWHSPEWEVPIRFKRDQQDWNFHISPAMLNAILLRFRDEGDTNSRFAMWIDQICIDQDNADEKFQAIANLDAIYRNAAEIKILLEDLNISVEEEIALRSLGKGDDGSENLSSLHIKKSDISTDRNSICASYGDVLGRVLSKVFDSRWFERAWCRHEYMLNSNATFITIGHQLACITLDPLGFRDIFLGLASTEVDLEDLSTLPAFEDFTVGINNTRQGKITDGRFFELFVQLQNLKCSYKKDVISISLNASGIRLSFVSDVTRQRECRYILALVALSAGDASVLGAGGLPMHRLDAPGHQPLLSWPRRYILDWSLLAFQSRPKIRDHETIQAISPQSVSLDMIFLLSQPSRPPREFKKSAAELSVASGTESKIFVDILRCILSFGIRWIDTTSTRSQYLWEDPNEIDEVRYSTINSAMMRLHPVNEDSMSSQFDPHTTRTAQFISRLSNPHLWFAWVERTTPLVISLNSAGTGWAILLVPTKLAATVTSGKYYITVPVALNTMQALSLYRVWILEPKNSERAQFALVGRGYYMGDRNLSTRKHDQISYGRRITIVGQWREDQFSENDSSSGE